MLSASETRESAGGWTRAAWVDKNIAVTVESASVGPVFYRDAFGGSQATKDYLTVVLGVTNLTSAKKVDFETWRDTATLVDNFENKYTRIDVNPALPMDPSPDKLSIHPKQAHHEGIVFELPIQNVKWLHLELSAKNFGGSGTLRFEIPAKEIK
jgi:hypothetical protein